MRENIRVICDMIYDMIEAIPREMQDFDNHGNYFKKAQITMPYFCNRDDRTKPLTTTISESAPQRL